MKHAEIRQAPDVPELIELLNDKRREILSNLQKISSGCDMNIFMNALLMAVLQLATSKAPDSESFDQVVNCLCECLKQNAPSIKCTTGIEND